MWIRDSAKKGAQNLVITGKDNRLNVVWSGWFYPENSGVYPNQGVEGAGILAPYVLEPALKRQDFFLVLTDLIGLIALAD